jgi:hypothetical protein
LALALVVLAILLVGVVGVQGWLVPAFQNWMSGSALNFGQAAQLCIQIGRFGYVMVPALCLVAAFGVWRARTNMASAVLVVQVAGLLVALFVLLQTAVFLDLARAFYDHPGSPVLVHPADQAGGPAPR